MKPPRRTRSRHTLRGHKGEARRQTELIEEHRTKLVADVVTGKLDTREVASSLPNEEGDDDWLESAPLADSLDDDGHVSEEPAECSAIESEVTA